MDAPYKPQTSPGSREVEGKGDSDWDGWSKQEELGEAPIVLYFSRLSQRKDALLVFCPQT